MPLGSEKDRAVAAGCWLLAAGAVKRAASLEFRPRTEPFDKTNVRIQGPRHNAEHEIRLPH